MNKYHFVRCQNELSAFGERAALIISIQTLSHRVFSWTASVCVHSSIPHATASSAGLFRERTSFFLSGSFCRAQKGSDCSLSSVSPRVRPLSHSSHRAVWKQGGTASIHCSPTQTLSKWTREWDKHQHRFPRTNLPKRTGVGFSFLFFFEGVPLIHTPPPPPQQHPEQVF